MLKDNLKFYRKKNNLTQKQIADYLGIAESSYANYEQGRGGELKISHLIKLCDLYLIEPNELLDYEYKKRNVQNITNNKNSNITNIGNGNNITNNFNNNNGNINF